MVTLRNLYIKAVLAVVILLTGCSLATDADLQAKVDAMSACDKIDSLISAYTDDFNAVKGPETTNRYMGIWSAKVNAVGKSCQVWSVSEIKATYVCTQNAPSEAVAMDWYHQAINTMAPCLQGWQQQQQQRKDGDGLITLWSKPGKFPTVSTHVFPVRNKHWSLYFFVGDHDERF